MNKSFKVVFSKARSALMVVNEATSSIQAKGTKTVIAVAAAMVAGGACAAQWVDSPVKEDSIVRATTTWDKVAETNSFVWTVAGETKTPASFLAVSGAEKEFTQQLWVTGTGAAAQASGIWTSGKEAKLVNKGTIYVTTGEGGVTWQNAALGADAGATVTNAGKIVVKNAHGMRIGTSTAASTIINDEAGAIYVEETGVGMELGGHSGSTAVNNGLISVGKKAGAYTIGVQFEKTGDTFTNNGTISAADADSAILVRKDATNSTINLEKTSSVDGLIAVLGTRTTINLNGTKDTLTISTSEKTEGSTDTTINVNDGADVELTDGKGATFGTVKVNDGKLSASIWTADNTFKSVTVEEDGIFNITKLNSRVDGKKIDLEKGIKGDRLLIARNQLITLKGGQLWAEGAAFTGTMKIGSSKQNSGTLTVSKGDYSFDSVQVYKNGTLSVTGGTLTINDLDTKLGKTTVSGGTLTVNGDLTLGASGSLTLSAGELKTTAANLFEKTASGDVIWSSRAAGIKSEGGTVTVTVTDAQKLTLDEVGNAHTAYSGIVFGDVTVVTKVGDTTKPADVTFDQLSGLGMALANNTVTVTSSADNAQTATAAVGAETIGVAALKLDSKVETLSLTGNSGTVVIGGNGGNVLVGVNSVGMMTVQGTLQLGRDASSVGVVNADTLSVGNLQVKGDATVGALTITGTSGSVVAADASLTAKEFTSGALAVTGTFAADKIASGASVTVNASGVAVLGNLVEGSVTTQQTAGSRLAMRSLTPEQLTKIDGKKYVSTNANVKTILQNSVFAQYLADSQAITSVLYIDNTIDVGTAGKVTLGTREEAPKTVTVGEGAAAVVDVSKFIGTDKVVVKGNIVGGGELALINATTLGSFTLADGEVTGVLAHRDAFKIDNNFISSLYTAADKTITLTVNEGFVGADLSDAVTTALGNSKNGEVLRAIGESEAFVDVDVSTNAKTLNDLGKAATEEYLALPVTAGTYNVAYDAAEQVTGAIQRHNTAAYQGTGVWADVYYSSNAGKEIYGGQGYSADIYGGVIGVDYTAACGAKMGAALTVGTGDADSEKSVSKFGNDADFYGLSVYAGKNVGDTSLYVSADASYLWLDNDITGNVAGASAAESIDSSVFTIGLRADWAAYAGDVMSVTPHVGIRYTNIDVDSYRGLDTGAMDVVEMPVGVKVAGNFETAGWKVTPAVDFTVVPQVGDKQVDTVVGAVDVIDNLYNTTLGVSAEYGNFTFGLNYRYGFGNNDRKNNSVNANVRYMF